MIPYYSYSQLGQGNSSMTLVYLQVLQNELVLCSDTDSEPGDSVSQAEVINVDDKRDEDEKFPASMVRTFTLDHVSLVSDGPAPLRYM